MTGAVDEAFIFNLLTLYTQRSFRNTADCKIYTDEFEESVFAELLHQVSSDTVIIDFIDVRILHVTPSVHHTKLKFPTDRLRIEYKTLLTSFVRKRKKKESKTKVTLIALTCMNHQSQSYSFPPAPRDFSCRGGGGCGGGFFGRILEECSTIYTPTALFFF